MASSVLVELQATTSEFMARMGEARAEVTKLGTEGSANSAKFAAVSQAAFLATGAAVAGVGVLAVDLAVKFDASVAKIQGSAQITQKAAQGIGDAFLHTAGDSTYSGKEMADAFGPVAGVVQTLAGHTLTAADAMKVMAAATDLAEATGQPLSSTTADLSAVMQAYGLNLNQASDASNILYNTSRLTGVPLDTLATTVDKLHGRLGIAAPDLASTGGLMEDLAQHGISGSRGVMVANTALTTLLGGTKPVTAELKTLGVNIFDSSGKFIGMQAALAQLSPKLADMSDKQRLLAESTLFGATSGVAMNSTILAGAPAFAKATAAVSAHDAVQKAAQASSQTLEGQIKTLKAGVEDYGTMLGEKLIPIITSVVGWIDKNKQLATDLTIAVAVLVVGLAAYYAITKTIEIATKAWTAAQTALNLVMDANPITLVIIAIAALVVAFIEVYQHCKAFRDAVNDAWSFIKQAFADGVALVKSHMAEFAVALLVLTGPIGVVIAAGIGLWKNWDTIWTEMKTITGNAVAVIVLIIKGIADSFMAVVGVMVDGAAKAFGWVPGVGGKLKEAAKAFDGFRSDVDSKLTAVANDAANWGSSAGNKFGNNFRAQANAAFASVLAQTGSVTAAATAGGAAEKQEILSRRASGGPTAANTPYLIGEEGPEIFVPDQAGTVLPNSVFGGTGGGTLLTSARTSDGLTSGGDVSLTIPLVVDGKTIATAVVPSVRTLLLQKKNQTGSLGLA